MQIEGGFRRKLGTACLSCKRRKVRCDITDTPPCGPCRRAGTECIRHDTIQGPPARKRRLRTSLGTAGSTSAASTSPVPTDLTGSHSAVQPATPSPTATKDETLTTFYERGIATRNWEEFHDPDPIRIVYVGTATSNLHHLVRTETDPGNCLHYPFPSIKRQLPWRPNPQTVPGSYLTADIAQDLSSFPTREVRDALVQTYFEDIHPGFPVIDEESFRRQYADPNDPPPLILFHTVLLAAARISDHPMVASARSTVTGTLFRRAKALFELRYENTRISLIQASLLLAWHVENSDTISCNSYYWIGQATRIAMGLGAHRDLSSRSNSLMPPGDKEIYRVIWWTVLQAETLTALEYGRPAMIRTEDFDQPPLITSDFVNIDCSADNLVNQSFCMLNAELCTIALDVLSINAPRGQLVNAAAIDERLATFAVQLPPVHDFWSCQVRITYNLVVLVLHRIGRSNDSATLAREAASAILTAFETLMSLRSIRKCSFHASTALLAAAVQFSQDVKCAAIAGSHMRALSGHSQLERLLRPMEELARYWPHIEALHKLCTTLHGRCSEIIRGIRSQRNMPAAIDMNANVDIPWQDIMEGYQLPDLGMEMYPQEWMSTF